MGRRKKTKNKIDLAVVSMIVVSILLAVLIYTNSGSAGRVLSPFLGGIIGFVKYILPVGIFLIGIHLSHEDKPYLYKKLIQYIIFLVTICAVLSIFQMISGKLSADGDFNIELNAAYEFGTTNKGGGVVGALVAIPLVKLLGKVGTVILCVGIATLILVYMLGLKPTESILVFLERIKEKREVKEDIEEQLSYKEKREIRRKEKEEEKLRKLEEKKNHSGQISINLNENNIKKYEHGSDDLVPLTNTAHIEANLFKQEDVKKEDKTTQVLQLEHALTVEDEHYEFPPVELMNINTKETSKVSKKEVLDTASKLQKTLLSFGVSAKVINASKGPSITRYEIQPDEGVRVNKIANLADDIALNLAAVSIRIEAPIPGKQAVGIEIPNKDNDIVCLRDIISSSSFTESNSKLAFALGKDVSGEPIVTDIAKMPHVLIAGATGSGKSVCINTLITSILYKAKPSEVKLVMIDPKVVELGVYNGIPHLLIPVVTDPKKAAGALAWAVNEMVNRYTLFAAKNVRDIKGYNDVLTREGTEGTLPQIVIIIDELADLMMVAPNDVEDAICRLAQMARAAGMHLVIATQRPSVDVITGIIKANIPSRISFAVSSGVDSRTILDMVGAERLLGKGDMLFSPVGSSKPSRIQGAYVSDKEVEKIVDFLKSNGEVKYNEDIIESIENSNKSDKEIDEEDDEIDEFLMEAIDMVVETGQASTSFIQRRFKVGYARAGRIIDQMEARGVISGYEGSKPRQVLLSKEQLQELKMGKPSEDEA